MRGEYVSQLIEYSLGRNILIFSCTKGLRLSTCSLRPAAIYGVDELRHLPRILQLIDCGLFFFRIGSATVDWVHVDNLVTTAVEAVCVFMHTAMCIIYGVYALDCSYKFYSVCCCGSSSWNTVVVMLAVVVVLVEVIMVLQVVVVAVVVMIVLEVRSHIIYYISGSGSGSSSVCFIILEMFSAYRKRSVHHTI